MIPVTRTDVSPGAYGSYQDVDVSAYVDAGNTAGVMLEVVNVAALGVNQSVDVRNNGSSDDAYYDIQGESHAFIAIGVDEDDVFECKIESADVEVYLVGYIKNGEGVFFTNAVDKSISVSGTWTDVDISGDTGANTAVCAFLRFIGFGTTTRYYGARKNGSTDARTMDINRYVDLNGAMMSVDESEIFEAYVNYYPEVWIWLVGYLTNNFSGWANAEDYSTDTTEEWEDVDMSSDIPLGNDGAFLHFYSGSGTSYGCGIRKNGQEYDNYYRVKGGQYLWVEINSGRVAEQKIQNTSLNLYLWGYTNQPAAPPPAVKAIVQAALISIPPLVVLPTLSQIIKVTGGC